MAEVKISGTGGLPAGVALTGTEAFPADQGSPPSTVYLTAAQIRTYAQANLAPVAASGSAGDITSGTLDAARLPIATATTVGVVSVTSGLSVTAGGALSANVRSVAGRTGDIVLTATDVSAQKVITSGTAAPTGGSDGDIYLRYT